MFSESEKQLTFDLQKMYGNKWKEIATYLPGISYYHVKNIWYHHRKKMNRIKYDSVLDEKIPKNSVVEKDEVEFITTYCDMLLRNDLKIVKDDDIVEKKQEIMYVDSLHKEKNMVDVYKGWYEKKFKESCEKYRLAKKDQCVKEIAPLKVCTLLETKLITMKIDKKATIVAKKDHVHQ